MPFTAAKFHGICVVCGNKVVPGDMIGFDVDGVTCEDCYDGKPAAPHLHKKPCPDDGQRQPRRHQSHVRRLGTRRHNHKGNTMSTDQRARAAHLIRGRLAIIRAEQQHLFEQLRLNDHDIEQTQKLAGEINQLEFEAKSREAELKILEETS